MRLTKAIIAGYRSLRNEVELSLDERVTVVLGANDHGKSNLLRALCHLNPDQPFEADSDLNWDRTASKTTLPAARYTLQLSSAERHDLRARERRYREQLALQDFLDAAEQNRQVAEDVLREHRVATDATTTSGPAERAGGTTADAERLLEAAHRRIELASAALFVNQAILDSGASSSSAIPDALSQAQTQLDAAHGSAAKAKERVEETAEAHAASRVATAAEDSRLEKAAVSARAALRRVEREIETLSLRVALLERWASVLEAYHEGTDGRDIRLPAPRLAPESDCPSIVELRRVGVGQPLELVDAKFAPDIIEEFVFARLPRVVLVSPVEKIPDTVNRKSLDSDAAIFMRGVFHYAGLKPEEWNTIFAQNDVTTLRLANASAVLNQRLRESWSQGKDLTFVLQHDSATKRIELVIKDPAVGLQFVRVSRRSSGFTHFFALKTILNAYAHEAPASAYVWAFDEPGVYLHPAGQHDLVQVMETLARANQVIYTTHSIFMANKNFPIRHRLVVKTEASTELDGKPFVSRWGSAIEALGMSMPGSLLFASRVLLVEGDSDSILINAMLQKLIELGHFERDINSLAVIAAGTAPDAAAVVGILRASPSTSSIAALFDGDEGGAARQRKLEKLELSDLVIKRLAPPGTAIEDHLPAALELYPRALAVYLSQIGLPRGDDGSGTSEDEYYKQIKTRLPDVQRSAAGLPTGLAAWARSVGMELGGFDENLSPVGLARQYAMLLQAASPTELEHKHALDRSRCLAGWIADALDLPAMTLHAMDIVVDDDHV